MTRLSMTRIGGALGTLALAIVATPAVTDDWADDWAGDLSPIAAADWSHDRAAHLLERAGFGGTPEEIARLAAMTPEQAVDWLVNYHAMPNQLAPFEESGIFDPGMEPFPRSRAQTVKWARADGEAMGVKVKPGGDRPYQHVVNKYFYYLRSDRLENHRLGQYWAWRMLATQRPLEEKIALFWHGHFATGDDKVRDYRKMANQLATFRRLGVGNFRDLVVAVAHDPAMLVYLDAGQNVKGSPNENFSREVLELFTIGIGNYTEADIREAARAFTGWTNDGLDFVLDTEKHDTDAKTFLGRTGNFDGTDILDIVLEEDATARFIVGKLYRFFVSDSAPAGVIDRLAARFRQDYEIAPLLRAMFLSKDFYAPHAYATQIKSPVQLVISTYRKLGLTDLPGVPDFHRATEALGQKLLYPPNVAGWEGGRSWITAATLMQRGNFARDVLFPPIGEFRAPDRALTQIYRNVGLKLDVGLDITAATIEGGDTSDGMMSMADRMVAVSDEEFNTRYAAYHGTVMAMKRVKAIPRVAAAMDLTAMARDAGVKTTTDTVDYFTARLLRARLSADQQAALVAFLDGELGTSDVRAAMSYLEEPLRHLLHLIMSAPEYQLG